MISQAQREPASVHQLLSSERAHPAIHFVPATRFALVGVVRYRSSGEPQLDVVTSTRRVIDAQALDGLLSQPPLPYRGLVDKWAPELLERFINALDPAPSFAEAFRATYRLFDEFLDCAPETLATLATWTLSTYFAQTLPAFPRLHLQGPMGSGKSKALSLIANLAFNGLHQIDTTVAALFRLIDTCRATIALDEVESLFGEDPTSMKAILNAGYKHGMRVPRSKQDSKEIIDYEVYAPIALGGIADLNETIKSRTISLDFRRGEDRTKLNSIIERTDDRFAQVRDVGFRLALLRWGDYRARFQSIQLPDWLNARERELWQPLLALASLVEDEGGGLAQGVCNLNLPTLLENVARQGIRNKTPFSEGALAVFVKLKERLGSKNSVDIYPADIPYSLVRQLGYEPRVEKVGLWLKELGAEKSRTRRGSKYTVTRALIERIERLLPDE